MTFKLLKARIYIDASNIFKGSRDRSKVTGRLINYPLDYKKLWDYLDLRYYPEFKKYFYAEDLTPSTPEFIKKAEIEKGIREKLANLGFILVGMRLEHTKEGEEAKTKGDLDTTIIAHLSDCLDNDWVKKIILFSGDGHFLPIIKDCYNQVKHVHVLSYNNCLNWQVKEFLSKCSRRGKYIPLDRLRSELEYFPKKFKQGT